MAEVILEPVVPEIIPGRDAAGTEVVVFAPVAVIGAVGLSDYVLLMLRKIYHLVKE